MRHHNPVFEALIRALHYQVSTARATHCHASGHRSLPCTHSSGPAGVPLIPVSAADTGKLPKREGPVTGSDIMEEALLEAQVARQAAAFIRGPPTE